MLGICRKAKLASNLTQMQRLFPDEFSFFPPTWVLPNDWASFQEQFKGGKSRRTFIVKPDAGCQGKGIFLTRTLAEVDAKERVVVQRYLHKPLLIDGYKFDLRLYVLVTSCDPLRIYVYSDGLGASVRALRRALTETAPPHPPSRFPNTQTHTNRMRARLQFDSAPRNT